jgi:hypothetical protein
VLFFLYIFLKKQNFRDEYALLTGYYKPSRNEVKMNTKNSQCLPSGEDNMNVPEREFQHFTNYKRIKTCFIDVE